MFLLHLNNDYKHICGDIPQKMAGGKIQQGQNLIIPQMNVCLLQRECARKQAYKFFMRLSSLTCMLLDWGMYVNACV